MGRYREFYLEDRETEDIVIRFIEDIVHSAYTRNKMNRDDRDLIISEVNRRVGTIMKDFSDFLKGDNRATESDIRDFCGREVNYIIDDIERDFKEQERERDSRYSRRDVGRLPISTRRTSDRGGFGLASGIRSNRSRNMETDNQRTARQATQASERSRQQEREYGQGKVFGNSSVPEPANPAAAKIAPKGTELTGDYAIVGNLGTVTCQLAASMLPATPTSNSLYNETEHGAVLLDNAIAVDVRDLEVNTHFTSATNAINFLKWSDSMLFSPSEYCHVVHFPKIKFAGLSKMGNDLMTAMHALKKQFSEQTKEQSIYDFLAAQSMMLNQLPPMIRTVIQAQVIRRWNTVAKCIFAMPKSPNEFLAADSWEHLLRFFTINESALSSNDPTLEAIKNRCDFFSGMANQAFTQKLHGVMEEVFDDLVGGNNGAINLRKECGEHLAGWEEFPVVIDKKYRAKDMCKMTEEQKEVLFSQFHADNVCLVERMSIIFTNMPLHDLQVHDSINRVTAEDIPVGQLLKSLCDKKDFVQLLYHINSKGTPEYVAHIAMTMDGALQLVKLKDNY